MSLNAAPETLATETAHATARCETYHCANCDEPFTPARADARYCSPGCRLKAHRAAKGQSIEHKPHKPRPGGHKLRRLDPSKPKRPCPPTPVAEKPYVDPKRSSLYTEDIATEICMRLSHGETLSKICKDEHLPSRTTVLKWVNEDHDFGNRFARARDLQFEYWADNLADVGDAVRGTPEQVPAARLDSENKRWLLARLKPSLYSEKFQADITSGGQPLQVANLDLAKALLQVLPSVALLPAPEAIDVDAVPVEPEGEAS